MGRKAQGNPSKQKIQSRPSNVKLDCDPTEWVMDAPCGSAGKSIGILIASEDKDLILRALEHSRGREAITQHLLAIEARDLFGCDEMARDAIIRPQDARILGKALEESHNADYITLLLANAVVNALIISNRGTDVMRRVGEALQSSDQESRLDDQESRLEKYHRGPGKRAKRKQDRGTLIKQYRDAGTTDAKAILDALRRDAPELANVKLKTIKNTLSILSKS